MGIGDFFKALFGGQPPVPPQQKPSDVDFKKHVRFGIRPASRRMVSIITMLDDLRQYLAERLQPAVENTGYEYEDHPDLSTAIESRIVVLEALPQTDAKLHARYDKLLRMKKAMGKTQDVLCVVSLREHYKKYPRGTYMNLQYFCINPDDLDHREPDLTPAGLETIEGPTLYNLCDIGVVIKAKIMSMAVAHPKKAP